MNVKSTLYHLVDSRVQIDPYYEYVCLWTICLLNFNLESLDRWVYKRLPCFIDRNEPITASDESGRFSDLPPGLVRERKHVRNVVL